MVRSLCPVFGKSHYSFSASALGLTTGCLQESIRAMSVSEGVWVVESRERRKAQFPLYKSRTGLQFEERRRSPDLSEVGSCGMVGGVQPKLQCGAPPIAACLSCSSLPVPCLIWPVRWPLCVLECLHATRPVLGRAPVSSTNPVAENGMGTIADDRTLAKQVGSD